jgi:hypothetical protein
MAGEVNIRQVVMDGANERFGKRLDHEILRLTEKG